MRNAEMYDLEFVLTEGRLTADLLREKADDPFKAYQALMKGILGGTALE